MIVPFFIAKIWEYTPKISFSFLDINSPSERQAASAGFVRRKFNEGYQHGRFVHVTTPNYVPSSPYFKYIERISPSDFKYHQEVCGRYYKVDTLDGSDYYQCQHGVKVK